MSDRSIDERRRRDLLAALRELASSQQRVHEDLASLVHLLNPICPDSRSVEDGDQAAEGTDCPRPAGVFIRTETQFPKALIEKYYSNQKDHTRLQKRNFWVGVASLVVLTVYAGFTYGILRSTNKQRQAMDEALVESKKANTLLRQQVVGSQAATVTLGLTLYPNNMLSLTFDQRGTAAARNVCFSFSAVRKSIPNLTDIGDRVRHTACEAVLSDKVFQGPHDYGLPGLTPAVMEVIRRTEETVMVEGELSYDNGFGEVQRGKACMYWLSGIPNRTEAQGGANGFVPCDGFQIRMLNVLKAKKEAEAKNQ